MIRNSLKLALLGSVLTLPVATLAGAAPPPA